jgi:hypothetical protein
VQISEEKNANSSISSFTERLFLGYKNLNQRVWILGPVWLAATPRHAHVLAATTCGEGIPATPKLL